MVPSRCQGIWRTENIDSMLAGMVVLLFVVLITG
jgi:hypothetical protein